ncbi:MAG: NAD-dependent epimerase/dehydratase family protein [Acidobacteriota bacterium]
MKPSRILILGGTAFLGPAVVGAARARGHEVTLFTRGKTRPDLFPDVERLHGNRDGDLAALADPGRRWDAVVDTCGYVPRVVRASAELLAPRISHYVFISSISALGDTSQPGADESAPVATMPDETVEKVMEFYGALKALCERAAEAAMPGRVANIRPGLIVGPGDPTDRFTYWPVRLARGGDVLAPGDGSDPVQIVDVRDLAAWIVRVIEDGTVGLFNATGPATTLTTRAMIEACRTTTEARVHWVGASFLADNQVAPWSDLPAWVPAEGEYRGFSTVECARATSRGLTFRPVAETARDTLAWWRTLPDERQTAPKAGLSLEREAEVLAAWHARPRT